MSRVSEIASNGKKLVVTLQRLKGETRYIMLAGFVTKIVYVTSFYRWSNRNGKEPNRCLALRDVEPVHTIPKIIYCIELKVLEIF